MTTGFSKGWKESFMSGEQEPWVFRGGLTADLQVTFKIFTILVPILFSDVIS